MSYRSVLANVFARWQRRYAFVLSPPGLVIALLLAGLVLLVQGHTAYASQNPPDSYVNNMFFYAYVGEDETLDVEFNRESNSGGVGAATITVNGPGGVVESCTIPAAGTLCSLMGLESTELGIWSIQIDGASSNNGFGWTINVRDGASIALDGRVWTDFYNMRDIDIHGPFTFWNLGEHGYLYEAIYGAGYRGVNSIFLVDGTGVRFAGTCVSAYRSALQSDGALSTSTLYECGDPYKQFFELPDDNLPETATRWDGSTDWVYPSIATPAINNIAFLPDSTVIRSGDIEYEVTGFTGQLVVEIDTNSDSVFDVQIPGFATEGAGSVYFDGEDGSGNLVPAVRDITVRVVIDRVGEAHFTNIDVEARPGGIQVQRLNGPGAPDFTIYWNDSALPAASCGTAPSPLDGSAGIDSSGGAHTWSNAGCAGVGGAWGDEREIDDWVYVPVDLVETTQIPGDELPEPFPACDARAFHSLSQAGDPASGWYDLDLVTGALTQLNPALGAPGADGDIFVNAIGYNVLDDRVYGIELSPGFGSTGYLIVIGGDNVGQRIGPVPGLDLDIGLITGDVSPDGFLYATTSGAGNPTVYVIDVDPDSDDFLTIVRTFDRAGSSGTNGGLAMGPDWVFRPGDEQLYSVRANNDLVRIDPDTGEITLLGTLTLPNSQPLPDDGGMGGMFLDAAGFLYGYRNDNGNIYRIDIDAGTATLFVATGFVVAGNDGARCPNAPLPIDFGDAPASYGTLLADNGARHSVSGYDTGNFTAPLMLGANIDIEIDGQPSENAAADSFDDGVVFNPTLNLPGNVMVTQAGEENTVVIQVVGAGFLSAWIDLNHNGVFDPEEQIFTDVPVADGEHTLTFTAPNTVPHGPTYARFRLSTQSGLGPTGPAPDGEVEDYLVYVAAPVPLTCDAGLINSGFELPNVSSDTPPALQVFGGGAIKIYHENVVPGWSFTASDPNATTGAPVPPEDQRNSIELWRTESPSAYQGAQFAEINAYVFGFLYQDMVTIPGATLSWQFAHRGRAGDDTIGLRIGPPGAAVTQTEQTTGNTAWQLYGGEYVVPDGQHITRFEFVAVDTADGNQAAGNFLDAIAFGLLCDPELVATKRASLQVDADADGLASPGDTLRYTVVINNTGLGEAINAVYADTPDANTTIVPGSVAASQGAVVSEAPEIRVELGNVSPDGVVTIVYDVVINNPLPADVTEVSNQGLVSVDNPNVPDAPTEDPETPEPGDPTNVPVTARPALDAAKQATLHIDADDSDAPSPGDTLLYTVRIVNSGNRGAADVVFTDLPDPNTSLVVGSVTTRQGVVTTGNENGHTGIVVNIGELAGGGGEVEITYQVVIDNPLAAGVTEIVNQGIVSTPDPDVPDVPTHDPNTPDCCDPTEVPVDARPRVDAYKTATLHVDADNNGAPSPGDTLLYEITIINSGNQATAPRTFIDMPDANTSLVEGSVTTSQGNVASGNSGGDTTVAVDIGSISGGGGEVVITYEAVIHDPLPAGVTEITNQGIVASEDPDEPEIPTDDPNTPGCCDPTEVPVDARPRVDAYKSATLFEDADGSGTPSPGDTLLYNITIINSGNQNSAHRWFFDTPDPNTSLVVGSVGTSQGAVVTGNSNGDTTIAVDIGSIPGGGGTVNISFRVVIHNPLPAGVSEIINQGIVTSDDPDEPDVPTDDPSNPGCCDPTETPVDTIPHIDAYKSAHLYEDADGNGLPSPGDTLLYTIRVVNSGNQAATGLIFTDTLDANTSLVVGSVATSRGAVIQGNAEGDASVGVNLGTLPGGAEAIITFRVVIDDPLDDDVTEIVNQGVVTSDDPRVPDTLTTDPRTPDCCDPTEVPVDARPRLRAYKSVTLLEDVDGSGAPSPGDALVYEITIINTGNQTANGLVFTDSPDPNTSLIVGSVGTTRGAVTGGNSPGDTNVIVDIGALPGGAQAVITFRVVIDNPLAAGVTEIANQGLVSSDDPSLDDILTDDPTTPQVGDPTSTHVEASPRITAYKQADLFFDADDSDGASAGDTLLYTIRVYNVGNTTAAGLVFNDTLDPNTTLLAGTVRSNRGAIVTGNNAGDTSIEVAIGDLPPRESATITFRVLVNDPLPGDLTELVNQGIVGSSSPDIPDVPTSDPRTTEADDPTVVSLPPSEPSNLNPEQQPGGPSRVFLPSIDRDSD